MFHTLSARTYSPVTRSRGKTAKRIAPRNESNSSRPLGRDIARLPACLFFRSISRAGGHTRPRFGCPTFCPFFSLSRLANLRSVRSGRISDPRGEFLRVGIFFFRRNSRYSGKRCCGENSSGQTLCDSLVRKTWSTLY